MLFGIEYLECLDVKQPHETSLQLTATQLLVHKHGYQTNNKHGVQTRVYTTMALGMRELS